MYLITVKGTSARAHIGKSDGAKDLFTLIFKLTGEQSYTTMRKFLNMKSLSSAAREKCFGMGNGCWSKREASF